jgi:hypothetical protein
MLPLFSRLAGSLIFLPFLPGRWVFSYLNIMKVASNRITQNFTVATVDTLASR